MLWWDDNAATNKGSQPQSVFMESEDSEIVPCFRSMGTIPIPRKISLGGRKSDLPNVNIFNDNISQTEARPSLRKVSAPNLVTSPTVKGYNPLPRRKISCPVAVGIKSPQNKTQLPPNKTKISCLMEVAPKKTLEKQQINEINKEKHQINDIYKEHVSEYDSETSSKFSKGASRQLDIKTSNQIDIEPSHHLHIENSNQVHIETSNQLHMDTSKQFHMDNSNQLDIKSFNQFNIETYNQNNNDSELPGPADQRESETIVANELKEKIVPIQESSTYDVFQKMIEIKEVIQTKESVGPSVEVKKEPKTQLRNQLEDLPTISPKLEEESSMKRESMSQRMEEFMENNMPTPELKRKSTKEISDKGKISTTFTFEVNEANVSFLSNEIYNTTDDLDIKIKLQKAKCSNAIKSEATNKVAIFKQKVAHEEVNPQIPIIKEELKRGSMKDKWGLTLVYQMSHSGGLCLGVLNVKSFSAGHKAKLQPGDHVLTINGWQIQSMEEPQVAANLFRAAGFSVVLGLERSNLILDQWTKLDDF